MSTESDLISDPQFPLQVACCNGILPIVRCLLGHKSIDPNIRDKNGARTENTVFRNPKY